jgi:hypothetical protein
LLQPDMDFYCVSSVFTTTLYISQVISHLDPQKYLFVFYASFMLAMLVCLLLSFLIQELVEVVIYVQEGPIQL